MLPRRNRLTSPNEFQLALRQGRRRGTGTLVVHYWCCNGDDAPRVGLAVSKRVGNSVQRHTVARRLRHLASARLHRLPPGSLLVLRALPGSGQAPSSEFGSDLDRALDRLLGAA